LQGAEEQKAKEAKWSKLLPKTAKEYRGEEGEHRA
jgi:hypothetical protein